MSHDSVVSFKCKPWSECRYKHVREFASGDPALVKRWAVNRDLQADHPSIRESKRQDRGHVVPTEAEVGVTIDEKQAEPAAALERKHRAELHRAVASENQCEFTTVEHMCDRVRELRAPLRDGACVESSSVSVSVGTVRWRFYTRHGARRDARRGRSRAMRSRGDRRRSA